MRHPGRRAKGNWVEAGAGSRGERMFGSKPERCDCGHGYGYICHDSLGEEGRLFPFIVFGGEQEQDRGRTNDLGDFDIDIYLDTVMCCAILDADRL